VLEPCNGGNALHDLERATRPHRRLQRDHPEHESVERFRNIRHPL
jgi:hypothetical protein